MKAKNIDGKIVLYTVLPKVWKNHLNFEMASEELLKSEGFYDVVVPSYDSSIEYLDNIHFNENCYTYDVIPVPLNVLAYRESMSKWHHPEYRKRIIVPSAISSMYPEIYMQISIHMMLNKLPIEQNDDQDTFYLYMNSIRPEHQELAENLSSMITIEDIPMLE